jgi:DNA-binding IclR family transcriptional regulator
VIEQTGQPGVAKVAGGQAIARAIATLRLIATAGKEGVRLTEVASELRFKIPTARRLLQALLKEELVLFKSENKTYHVGVGLISLGAAAASSPALAERYMPALFAIANATKDTVYLMIPKGVHAVCLSVIEGQNPVRVLSLEPGDIRPLGAGSASLALYAFLPDEQRQMIRKYNIADYRTYHLTVEKVESMARETRNSGFAFNPGLIIKGVYGVGFPIFEGGKLVAAIGVAAIKQRLDRMRQKQISRIVQLAVSRLPGLTVDHNDLRQRR